ncbi:MAG: undecaprenyl-diphosphate phosphatase [Bacteroidota bacterium]|nr:undecaprenyl-diphosphate phosphatase [Bacteroidota bacterium]MDP4226312.1 undecaprenyl-diphosphate phosphatase [Bacteroidota bacterium]MDP4274981.1 undecaprenyl-diphosphate phosphatase [Bacteroidota bacterium]
MSIIQTIILGIVEGITEFLPISSTGHMIITEKLLGLPSTPFINAFIVNIQFGAILSVIVLYWKRFFQTLEFYYKLFVAFLPAAVIGFLLNNFIDSLLGNVVVVAVSLVLGGIILLFVDNWFKHPDDNQEMTYKKALKVGFFQVISMIPGVSRSAATIIGGMQQKLTRKNAAEFSFFLAVPTMFGASVLKLYKTYKLIDISRLDMLLVGNLVAFVVAMVAIKTFISFLTNHGFKLFGYYRIVVGLLILVFLLLGYDLNLVG